MNLSDSSAPTRAALYVAGMAVLAAAAVGVGRLVGPVEAEASPAHSSDGSHTDQTTAHDDQATDADARITGLAQASGGYRLDLVENRVRAGSTPFTFAVAGPDGPLRSYDQAHERDLHLIVVRRDLTGFQHLHPSLDASTGDWSIDLDLAPGSWRVLADFVPSGGEQLVLGADLVVEGAGETEPLGGDVLGGATDGYDVIVELVPQAGEETSVVATVMRDGAPVTDLGRYLGELGHLVVLRDGDLAYAHGHPEAVPGTGPRIPFAVTFPSGGRYRMFLEFEHDGAVHTVPFTVSVEAGDGHTHSHGDESDAHEH